VAILRQHLERGTIRTVLERLQDYTSGEDAVIEANIPNVILGLFNIADELPTEERSFADFGASMDMMRILFQFGKRIGDGKKFKEIVLPTIKASSALAGIVEFVSLETPRDEKDKDKIIIPGDLIGELQSACVEKIKEFEKRNLLFTHPRLLYILYRWKEWSDGDEYADSIAKYTSSDQGLVDFLKKFVYDQKSQTIGEYAVRKEREYNFRNLAGLFDLNVAKERLESIRTIHKELVEQNQEMFDLFFAGIDKAIQNEERNP